MALLRRGNIPRFASFKGRTSCKAALARVGVIGRCRESERNSFWRESANRFAANCLAIQWGWATSGGLWTVSGLRSDRREVGSDRRGGSERGVLGCSGMRGNDDLELRVKVRAVAVGLILWRKRENKIPIGPANAPERARARVINWGRFYRPAHTKPHVGRRRETVPIR